MQHDTTASGERSDPAEAEPHHPRPTGIRNGLSSLPTGPGDLVVAGPYRFGGLRVLHLVALEHLQG
jgi:hypothetical protein